MGIKEILIFAGVLLLGYWLGTNGVLARFLPS